MNEFDISKFQYKMPDIDCTPQLPHSVIDEMNRKSQEMIQNVQDAREKREAEELRRHNELVAALKEAGEKGATIVIGDNANGIQIQQNSSNSSQKMTNTIGLDYEQVLKVLAEIKEYFEYPKFQETFGDNTENVKAVVESTIDAVKKEEDEGLIKKSLHILKDLAVGAAGSLIASGILALLGTIPIG